MIKEIDKTIHAINQKMHEITSNAIIVNIERKFNGDNRVNKTLIQSRDGRFVTEIKSSTYVCVDSPERVPTCEQYIRAVLQQYARYKAIKENNF